METGSGESVIADAAQKMILTIEPAQRRAMLIDIPDLPDRSETSPRNILERMRQVLDGSEKPLGRRQIDRQPAQGFSVTRDNREMEVWAERGHRRNRAHQAELPHRGPAATRMALRNIVLNADMPDSLFRLVPPEGFTLENHAKNLGNPGEQDLAEGLARAGRLERRRVPRAIASRPSRWDKTIEQNLAAWSPARGPPRSIG